MNQIRLEEEKKYGFKITTERKKIWQKEAEIYQEVKRACDMLGLKIFADSGTLLGAVRDKGFIPWDDDMDFVMPRKDYMKLIQEGNKILDKKYILQSTYLDENYYRSHVQVRMKGTTAILKAELKNKNIKFNQGIFIDIFPIDYLSKYEFINNHFAKKIRFYYKLYRIKLEKGEYSSTSFKRIVKKIISVFLFHKPIYYFKKADEISQNLWIKGENCDSIFYYSLTKRRNHLRASDYNTEINTKFENFNISIPNGYDNVLKEYYGSNYMTPKKDNTSHGNVIFNTTKDYKEVIKEIETGKYKEVEY